MAKYFIFLEVLDPEINGFFRAIHKIVSHKDMNRAAHLTIRGPYKQMPEVKTLEKCRGALRNAVLRIGEIGRFSNPGEETVYFRVDSPNLREVWYKPDYAIKHYGFNPHFSIYRGRDANYADLLADFIRSENIELLCTEFRVVPYLSAQAELLPTHFPISSDFPKLLNSGRVRTDFVEQLHSLVNSYQQGHQLQTLGRPHAPSPM